MKIVCDACGTRYSIEDSRVAGRSFKIRCKQCAHVILLPGTRAPTAEPAAAGTWHAVIDGMPRPIGVEDLRQLRTAGVLDDRTLVWREGLDDWRELGSVDELRAPGLASVVIAPEAATDSTAVDLPKASDHAGGQGGVPDPARERDRHRHDAGAEAAPEDPPGPAPLRGVRHENSVLFSLGNLARLAAPAPSAASPAGRTEGSGLLDVQSLARSLAAVRDERGSAAVEELPVYGALPFAEPAVLIPSSPPRRDRRLIWALAATAGALVAVTVILVVIVLRGGTAAHAGTPPALPAGPGAPPPAATAPGGVPAAPAAPGALAHAEPTATDPTRASTEVAMTSADRTEHAAADPSATRTDHTAASSSADRAEPAASPAQTGHAAAHAGAAAAHGTGTAPAPHGPAVDASSRRASPRAASPPADGADACSEVACIVNGYADPCCAVHRQRATAPAPAGGELPERLDRPGIASGLARIDTSGCGKQSSAHGEVKVSVQVSPAGAVTGVTVKSSPDPALEACVTAAVRTGAFPATQRGGSFGYAWRF